MRKELLLGYFAQALGIISNLLIIPIILNSFGSKIFGVYSFFLVLSGLVNYIDIGMSTGMIRLTKQFQTGSILKEELTETYQTFQSLIFILDLLFVLILFLLKNGIIEDWDLGGQSESIFNFVLIAASLKFLQTIYRGTINGAGKVSALHFFSICSIFLRSFFLVLIILTFDISVLSLFQYLTLVSIIEISCLIIMTGKFIPELKGLPNITVFNVNRIIDNFKFIGSIALGSLVWTLVTQMDKFILGITVELKEFGLNQAGVTLASSILLITAPISKSLLPRFVKYNDRKQYNKLFEKYLSLSALLAVVGAVLAFIFFLFGELILNIWLGSNNELVSVSKVLLLFAIGNAISLIGSGAYYLQFSFGDLKFYRISNVVYTLFFILLTVPAIYFHGFIGAGYSWIVSNLFIIVVVNSKLNSHFDKNLNTRFWRKILFRLFQIILIITVSYYFISLSSWNNLFKFSSFVIIVSIGSYFIVRKDLLNLLGE